MMDATELRQSSSSGDHVEVEPSASARSRAGWFLPLNPTASILAYRLLQRSGFYLVSSLASSQVRCLVRYPLPFLLAENLTCCSSEEWVYISRAQSPYFRRPCCSVFLALLPELQPLFLEHSTVQQHVVRGFLFFAAGTCRGPPVLRVSLQNLRDPLRTASRSD